MNRKIRFSPNTALLAVLLFSLQTLSARKASVLTASAQTGSDQHISTQTVSAQTGSAQNPSGGQPPSAQNPTAYQAAFSRKGSDQPRTWPSKGNPHTLLWKVTGNGLKAPSYLFGTMHVLCADDAQLSDSLKYVIGKVDQVYFEIDLGDMSAMMNSLKYMRMNDSKKLSDLLSPQDYEKVRAYFTKNSPVLPFGMLERFKPMLISSLLEEQGMGCKTTDGMELMIMKELHAGRNQPVKGLETIEFQAGLFDSIPYEQQAKDLISYIDSADQYKKTTLDLAKVYKEQDLDKIDELSTKDDSGMTGHMDLLLYGRNRSWVRILTPLFKEKTLLVAVGAAHLPGDQGVISLLRRQGFTVSPVKN